MNKNIIIILFLLSNLALFSQEFETGMLSKINLSKSFNNGWKLNSGVESRQLYLNGTFGDSINKEFKYERTDFSIYGAKKIGLHQTLIGGYIISFKKNKTTHRFIQQFSTINKFEGIKLAHRFSLNQLVTNNFPLKHIVRYRIALEKALNGLSIDPKEFYVKLNSEYLLYIEKNKISNHEIRTNGSIGYKFNNNNKLELGIDYRLNNINSDIKKHQYWIFAAWFINI